MVGNNGLLSLLVVCISGVWSNPETHLRGPTFLVEPPPRLDFSNNVGALLNCSGVGNPPPTAEWMTVDGAPVADIPTIRRVLPNGTLRFLSFPAGSYRQDIHSAVYRCMLTNSVGRVLSRDVHVRAVVAQPYEVQARARAATRGTVAVLRCDVPGFVRDLVQVAAWIQEPAFAIFPSTKGDGKFHMHVSGELHILNVDLSDSYISYRCRTIHRLTGEEVVSPPVTVLVEEPKRPSSPFMLDQTSVVHVTSGDSAILPCASDGSPPPTYNWLRLENHQWLLVQPGSRVFQVGGSLVVESSRLEDAGTYRCTVSNSKGEVSKEIRLVVSGSLSVQLSPALQVVDLGNSAEFLCSTGDDPSVAVTWYKDGKLLNPRVRLRLIGHNRLHISHLQREDKGMYQCFVKNEYETAQSAAELKLGDTYPSLLYTFIEQTMQPGPAVSLKCSAAGNPTPQITWALDGFPLPDFGRYVIGQYVTVHGDVISYVNVSSVKVEDGGEYTCTTKNRAGEASHSARLNIYGAPYIRPISKVTAVAGKNLVLKCPVAGYPIEGVRWERGNRELPVDVRQKVFPNGTLVIEHVQPREDAGEYTCTAWNKQGDSARRSGEVAVIVPPKVSPFFVDQNLHLGERTTMTCTVTKGDLPLQIGWLKEGQPVLEGPLFSILRVDVYTSILTVARLTSAHNGNYTCLVENAAAAVTYTQQLLVNVRPQWLTEPQETRVERNRAAWIHCQAEGVPTPVITWKKAIGDGHTNYEPMGTKGPGMRIFPNGSLFIQQAREEHEGHYLCQANNGIGNGLGKVVQLMVEAKPYFVVPSRTLTVKRGDTAALQCEVLGDKPISIIWRKGDAPVTSALHYVERVSSKLDQTSKGVVATLSIRDAKASDSDTYQCVASNRFGRDQQAFRLWVQEPPDAPHHLQMVDVTSTAVKLQWQHPQNNYNLVTKYIIQYKEMSDVWHDHSPQLIVSGSQNSDIGINQLKPATSYMFRIFAENSVGRSQPSEALQVTTLPEKPGSPPINVRAESLSSTELRIMWQAPEKAHWNGKLLGYYVGYKLQRSMHWNSNAGSSYNFTTVHFDGDLRGECHLTNLRKFTKYVLVVQAFNKVGPGPLSDPFVVQTLEDVPSMPPQEVRCTALTSDSLQVSWQPPPMYHANGIIQGYKIQYEPSEDWYGHSRPEEKKTTAVTMVLISLHKYTNYSVSLTAFTKVGTGVQSPSVYCRTDEDVPGPPADVKAVVSSSTAIIVSWLPPKFPNGVITQYNLYVRTFSNGKELHTVKRSLLSQHTHYKETDLASRTQYQFWVTASTRIGEGQSSKLVSQTPTAQVPAKIYSFGTHVVAPWKTQLTLPCDYIGQPQPTAEWHHGGIRLKPGGRMELLESGRLVLQDLQQTDSGNYTCQVGNGQSRDRIEYRLTVQVPPSAPLLHITTTNTQSIHLHWKQGDAGGSPILGFLLNYKRANGEWEEINIDRHLTSYELADLQCGTTYMVFLTALNKIGTSPSSEVMTSRTKGDIPSAPPSEHFLTANSTSVVLHLLAWMDNGCPVMHFSIEYRTLTRDAFMLVANDVKPMRQYTILDLESATAYKLRVTAYNHAGLKTAEYDFITLTKEGGMPPPELVTVGTKQWLPFYANVKIMAPIVVSMLAVIATVTAMCLCWRNKFPLKYRGTLEESETAASLDNKQNAMAQREQFYATIHKHGVPPIQEVGPMEKVPESSEDIYPYATFHLPETAPRTQDGSLFHSFIYHEQRLSEGGATPSRSMSKEDYSLASKCKDFVYHAAESSTSPELSPLSEQRSLPWRSKSSSSSKWGVSPHQPPKGLGGGKKSRASLAETSFAVASAACPKHFDRYGNNGTTNGATTNGGGEASDPHELSEAECDIDTLHKIKAGHRVPVWYKPSSTRGNQDYSIAV